MSANDILDVLNVQRGSQDQPQKKKQKLASDAASAHRQAGLSRELYSLLGPNTPPANLSNATSSGARSKFNLKPSPWTRQSFKALSGRELSSRFHHWVKGSKELIEQEPEKPNPFEKFNVRLDLPELPTEEIFDSYMAEIRKEEEERVRDQEKKIEADEKNKSKASTHKSDQTSEVKKEDSQEEENKSDDKSGKSASVASKSASKDTSSDSSKQEVSTPAHQWTYEQTAHLFQLCDAFELKWPLIHDRFKFRGLREEDLKEQFYRISAKVLKSQPNSSHSLIEQLGSYSRVKEIERKQYLEKLLKRTPAEIAEEESLVIEARRFELAAKKMLVERSQLLTLLDSPQVTQSTQQYQSSQGLANLYNNLMIIDKHQKKRQLHQQLRAANNSEPLPPPIPSAASSSYRRDRTFQTHLQQYLSNLMRQSQSAGGQPNAIQELLMKRLTLKEEEAYGLHYHANERLTSGVMLRSAQRLAGTQQRQSVLRSVNSLLQELDIPTGGGTTWRPVMPTRKTMAKYDELIRSVVVLLDVKRARDKLESEITLIRTQRGIEK